MNPTRKLERSYARPSTNEEMLDRKQLPSSAKVNMSYIRSTHHPVSKASQYNRAGYREATALENDLRQPEHDAIGRVPQHILHMYFSSAPTAAPVSEGDIRRRHSAYVSRKVW